ncbi:MAG: hypothetical protein HY738_20340 [Bacteroidia bacterium]|nr:hypothetical protein [Bacteroidia bacterium]
MALLKKGDEMSDLTVALLTIFGTVASVAGVVLFVFNGTKSLIKEMHEGQRKMEEIAEQRHQEVLALLDKVVALLDKGFGNLSQHRAT